MHKEKTERFKKGDPGFGCHKSALVTNTTFTERPICTASRQYMRELIKQIEQQNLTPKEKEHAINKMAEKSCLCIGLSTSLLKFYNIPLEGDFVTMCPGPNLVYFKRQYTLREMVDHIYGRTNLIDVSRPTMFVKELSLYVSYLKQKLEESNSLISEKERQYFVSFKNNLLDGIKYYYNLIPELKEEDKVKEKMRNDLKKFEDVLHEIRLQI
jgi:hypothetical protein